MFQSVLVDRAASPSLRARDCGQEVGAKAPFDAHRFATPYAANTPCASLCAAVFLEARDDLVVISQVLTQYGDCILPCHSVPWRTPASFDRCKQGCLVVALKLGLLDALAEITQVGPHGTIEA